MGRRFCRCRHRRVLRGGLKRGPSHGETVEKGRQGAFRTSSRRVEVPHRGEQASVAHTGAFAATPLSVVGPNAAKPLSRGLGRYKQGTPRRGGEIMRALVVAGEAPTNRQHVATVVEALSEAGDETLLVIGRTMPGPHAYEARTRIGRMASGFLWARFGWARNRYRANDWRWEGAGGEALDPTKADWTNPFPPGRGRLPWKPDIVIVVTPNQGWTKHQVIPWAQREGIPVLSIDHGSPTLTWPWLTYRGSMMGCDANAVWSEVCRDINVGVGAPERGQIITGSPSLDGLDAASSIDVHAALGLEPGRKIVLMLGSHRAPVKGPADALFAAALAAHGGRDDLVFVHKPHPVELSQGSVLSMPDGVVMTIDQDLYLPLVRHATVVLSPATSVVIPALAFRTPFVNSIRAEDGAAPAKDVEALLHTLKGAVFDLDDLAAVLDDGLRPDDAACERAFARLGHRADGRNGARVASLARWLVNGGVPNEWTDEE